MREAETIVGLIRERGKKGLPLERVYKLLFNRNLYLKAYGKIYPNKGAMTHGVTEETPDGMSLEKIDAIIEALRYEHYQWLPAKRAYIPKKNGEKRPLGLPVWSDKLVQEVIRLILEAYYEPRFSEHSHGFRAERGCHRALREIHRTWKGTVWFIEGDISHCFDKLSHELIIQKLEEDFHDGRFIRLMQELLNTGYMEEWTLNTETSGVPQGGIVSPILANILLDKLDTFVEETLIPKYTRGRRKRANQDYHSLIVQASKERKRGNMAQAEQLRKQAQKLPSIDPKDPAYRRLRYVRYADDFLLGFDGPQVEAEEIKQELRAFLQRDLKLELSEEKTLVTHARTEAAKFLGYEVMVIQDDSKRPVHEMGIDRRSHNGKIGLRVPRKTVEENCQNHTRKGKVIHRPELLYLSDYDIVMVYQSRYRGIANYYQMAYNMHSLGKLKRYMEVSLLKTLAAKHKMSVQKVVEKYRASIQVQGKEYKVLQVVIPREGKKPLVATWGGIPLVWDSNATLNEQPPKLYTGHRTELVQRLLAEMCELCGSTEDVEVHHVRAIKDLHEYPGRERPLWVLRMIAMRRKTMPVCHTCHEDIHAGRPLRRQPMALAEVKALQKAKTRILESRMH
jgi:group II intron reverse transcriptase/maturase